jgi:hypothetical protein
VTVDEIYIAEGGQTPEGALLTALVIALDVPADLLVEQPLPSLVNTFRRTICTADI